MAMTVVVRVVHSANGLVRGQVIEGELNERLAALIDMGVLEVENDGTGETGPSGPAPGDQGRLGKGAAERGTTGGEPGEGFGTGGYGSAASFD